MSIAAEAPTRVENGTDRAAGAPDETRRQVAPLSAIALREIVLTLFLVLCYGFVVQIPVWNENSRYNLVRALVDDHTTSIDPYHENTNDKAYFRGHYYSDKPPGSSLLAAPTYALIRLTSTLGGSDLPNSRQIIHALAFTAAGLPTVLLVLLLLRFLRSVVGEWWALTMSLGYALGSLAFPFATMYFGHAASTAFLFAAFYFLWRARDESAGWKPLVAGLSAGWAVLTEFPVALGVAVLLVYAAWLSSRHAVLFVLGGLPGLAILLGYNWVSFGHPFSIGYQHSTAFTWQNSQGLISVVWPQLSTTRDLLLAERGLLTLSPWFVLLPFGLWAMRRAGLRAELLVCLTMVVAFLTYNSGALNPFGGWTPGPRYLLPALPFASVLIALASPLFRPLTGLLLAYSIVVTFAATVTMPNARESVRDPLVDLWIARLLAGDLGETTAWLRWGLSGLQPLFVLVSAAAIAAGALYASYRRSPVGREIAQTGACLLAVLVVAFSTPLDLTPLFQLGSQPSGIVEIGVVEAGASPGARHDRPAHVVLWAQLENRGEALQGTSVVLSIRDQSGQQVWSGSHEGLRWRQGERKRLTAEWPLANAELGDYQMSVAVRSVDQQEVLGYLERQVNLLRRQESGKVHLRTH